MIRTLDMSRKQLRCTAIQHAWEDIPTKDGYTLSLRCVRCTKERHDKYNLNTGELVKRRYIDPAHWHQFERGTRPTMGQVRVNFVRSLRTRSVRKVA